MKTAKVNVDGTDFRICNKKPFCKEWYSHKFNGPALRYEVASCIQTGDIVWINGPFKAGKYSDITIFRDKLKFKLKEANEKAEADDGYRGEKETIRLPKDFVSKSDYRAKKKSRTRHETINGRFKQFSCLSMTYRHSVDKHGIIFRAVACIVQISFECGEKPFQVNY